MARFGCVALLLGFILAGAVAATGGGCEVSHLAAEVAVSCAAGAATPPCCEPVLASVELGGAACFCRVASEMPVLHAGLNGSALLALYADCGGDDTSVAACHGPPATATGSFVRALSSTIVDVARVVTALYKDSGEMPESLVPDHLAGGQHSPPPAPSSGPAKIIHLTSRHKKALTLLVVCQVIEVPVMLAIGAYKLYRRCYAARK